MNESMTKFSNSREAVIEGGFRLDLEGECSLRRYTAWPVKPYQQYGTACSTPLSFPPLAADEILDEILCNNVAAHTRTA